MPVARQILLNPANKNQRMTLYSNGHIQASGGAPQVTMVEAHVSGWTNNEGAPYWTSGVDPAKAFQVLDWSIPRGYTLDQWGYIWPWGGAVGVAGQTMPNTGGPEFLFGNNGGFQSVDYGFVQDFKMDPSNGGTGYYLLYDGGVVSVGTGVTVVPRIGKLGNATARQLALDWSSKRFWVLDTLGRVTGYNGGNDPTITAPPGHSGVYTFPQAMWGTDLNNFWGHLVIYDFSATCKGWFMDSMGRFWRLGSSQDVYGFEWTPNIRQWSGAAIVDDGTGANPLRLVQMTAQGRTRDFIVSTAPIAAVNEPTGTFSNANKPWVGWLYIDKEGDAQSAYEVRIANSTAYQAGATSEVQSVATTGTPSGGTFKLGFQRSANAPIAATADIAYNAAAATIQSALEALPNIGTGGVVCAGGPLPTAVSVTFQNQMSHWDWPTLTLANNALTGGSSPTVTRTVTTPGVGANPAGISNVFNQSGSDTTTRVRSTAELANSTTFRAFVRVTDTAGQQGAWDYSQFATAFTALNTPTVTPTVLGGNSGISLRVNATTGAGLPGTARFAVQFQDAGSSVWYNVRNGDALVPDGSGVATVVDFEAPFGVQRSYRAVTYVYDSTADLWQQSPWSSTANATLGPQNIWSLTNPFSTTQLVARVRSFETNSDVVAGEFVAASRQDPIVMQDGAPKLPSILIDLWSLSAAERAKIEALAEAAVTLLLRSPYGERWYVRLNGDYTREYLRVQPIAGEATPTRDAKVIRMQTQAVKRPQAGPTSGPLLET